MSSSLNFHSAKEGFTAKAVDFTETAPEFVLLEITGEGMSVNVYLHDVKSAERIINAALNARNILQGFEIEKDIRAFFGEDDGSYDYVPNPEVVRLVNEDTVFDEDELEEIYDCGDDSSCDEPRCPSYRKYEDDDIVIDPFMGC